MGGGAGKQKNKNNQPPPQAPVVQQQSRRSSAIVTRGPSPPDTEQLAYAPVQGAAGHSRTSVRSVDRDDPIMNRLESTPSPPPGSALPTFQQRSPSILSRRGSTLSKKRPSVGAGSLTGSHHHHGHSALSGHEQSNRYCSHCPHCKRQNNGDDSISSTPTPPWLKVRPDDNHVCINMDHYDTDALKEKPRQQNGHSLLTATSVSTRSDYDATKENYFTLPFVAKTSPRVTPTCTPFPGYSSLQRKERRANKPFTSTLFVD